MPITPTFIDIATRWLTESAGNVTVRELLSLRCQDGFGKDVFGNAPAPEGLQDPLPLFLDPFLSTFLDPLLFGEGNLVLYVSFSGHVEFVVDFLLRRKGSNFSGFEQELEQLSFETFGHALEVLHVVERVAEFFEDGRIRFKRMPGVGELQEQVLDAVGHQFIGITLPELISVEHLVGPFMDGEVHDSDEVHGREIVRALSGNNLLLDGEGGVEDGSFIEELLLGELHFYDEPGAVFVGTFDIDADALVVGEGVDVFLGRIVERNDPSFRDEFLKKEGEESLSSFDSEGPLEPVVEQDSGVSPRGFRGVHGFFPQTSGKEPSPKKFRRLITEPSLQARRRPIPVRFGRHEMHFLRFISEITPSDRPQRLLQCA